MSQVINVPGKRCNNSCFFCTYTGRDPTRPVSELQQEIPTGVVKAWMRKCGDKSQQVVLRGVEPALRSDLVELLRYAKQIKIANLALESNGRIFCYRDFCSKVIAEGVSDFIIYLFGPNSHLHDTWSKVQGSFGQSVQGIRNLLELNAKVKVIFFLSAKHDHCIGEYVEIIRQLRPTSVAFLYLDLENTGIRTVDQAFVQSLGREIRDLIENLRGTGVNVEHNGYPESLDLSTFFDDLAGDRLDSPKNGNLTCSKAENRKRAAKEFGQRRLALSSRPAKLFVELTRNCNFRCVMCPQPLTRGYDRSLDMPWPLFKKVADSLFPSAEYVDLRGFGESIIMKDWRRCLDYCLRFDTRYGLVTNLSLHDDEMWELMVRNSFFLGVSFDGATKKTFEYIRRGANFDIVLGNLRSIARWRREYGMPEENVKLMVTVQRENIQELPAIVELAREVGVKQVQFSPSRVMYEEGVLDRDEVFNHPEVVDPILKRSLALARKHGIRLLMTGSLKQRETENAHGYRVQQSCDHPWTCLYITAEGHVGPCNQLMLPLGILLGDLQRNTFEEVWNNFNFRQFRKLMHTPHRLNHCDWCFQNRYGD